MSEGPSTPIPKPDRRRYSSKYSSKDGHSPALANHRRSRWRKLFIPFAFFAMSAGLGILTFTVVYPPAETGIPEPYYSTMQIYTSAPINSVGVTVEQDNPKTTAVVAVSIGLVQNASTRPQNGTILLTLPVGITFRCDPTAYCRNRTSVAPSAEIERFRFKSGSASCFFLISAHNFSVNFDDINAYAAIPEIILHLKGPGSENPIMIIGFHVPAPASYDWSSFPSSFPSSFSPSRGGPTIAWAEPLVGGETPGRVINGTNHARQRTDANMTFLAGALIGVAGAALLISVQEAMHSSDGE